MHSHTQIYIVIHSHTQLYIVIHSHTQPYIVIYSHTQSYIVIQSHTQSYLGYDRITLRRSRNRNRIFHYLIPVLLTGTGICHGKSGSGRTGTGFFRIESGSGKNRISRSDRNSGRNRNITNAIPERTEIAENDKNRFTC